MNPTTLPLEVSKLRVPKNVGALKGVPDLGTSDYKFRRSGIHTAFPMDKIYFSVLLDKNLSGSI